MLQPESVALARTAAERSFVLLKNSPSSAGAPLLPLSGDLKNVALIGPLADDAADMLGSWSAQGHPEDVVTLRAALAQKLGSDQVRYAKGSEITKGSEEQLAEAVKTAQESDTVILALGEGGPNMTGEAASRPRTSDCRAASSNSSRRLLALESPWSLYCSAAGRSRFLGRLNTSQPFSLHGFRACRPGLLSFSHSLENQIQRENFP